MQSQIKSLQLRHYRLIQTITDAGQLSVAADRLAISQPAASRSLAEIEALVGAPLFDRHPKGMSATLLGEVLSRRAGALLGEIDEAESEVRAIKAGRAGTVRVGAVTGAAIAYVVPAVHRLKQEAETSEIRVQVAPSIQLMDDLLSGELDFILSRVPSGVEGNRLDLLHGRIELITFLVRAGHPLLARQNVDLEALSTYPWIIQERGMPIREAVDAAHIRAGLPLPSDVVDSASLLMTLAYLKSSNSVAPVASEVASLFSSDGPADFVALDMSAPIAMSPYHLIRQSNRPIGPIAHRLLEFVQAEMSD